MTPTATRACARAGSRPGAGFSSVEDIFQAFFGRGFGFEVRTGPMRGQDLVHRIEITAVEAMLGTAVTIPSHEGDREIELPPGIQAGTQFALRGNGLPGSGGGPPGDLIIAVQVIVPTNLSDEQRELAEKLDETIGPQNLGSGEGRELLLARPPSVPVGHKRRLDPARASGARRSRPRSCSPS